MKPTLLIFALLFARPGLAADEWTERQAIQQAGFTLLLAVDWAQTRDIQNHPGFQESNPILGEHPTDKEIDQYFVAAAVGHAVITHFLPTEWRDAWQYTWIGIEANTTVENYRLGVRFDLH